MKVKDAERFPKTTDKLAFSIVADIPNKQARALTGSVAIMDRGMAKDLLYRMADKILDDIFINDLSKEEK